VEKTPAALQNVKVTRVTELWALQKTGVAKTSVTLSSSHYWFVSGASFYRPACRLIDASKVGSDGFLCKPI
jgi:hypothetical protein